MYVHIYIHTYKYIYVYIWLYTFKLTHIYIYIYLYEAVSCSFCCRVATVLIINDPLTIPYRHPVCVDVTVRNAAAFGTTLELSFKSRPALRGAGPAAANMYIHSYIYTYIHIYRYLYMYICIQLYTHTHIYIYTYEAAGCFELLWFSCCWEANFFVSDSILTIRCRHPVSPSELM